MKLYRFSFLFLFFFSSSHAQIKENNIEIRVKNDDAGEISNWLNTGNDLGETQSLLIGANILNKHPKYNFRLKVESTEYSTLDKNTPEPRDIFFRELNNFQLGIDNNKFKNNATFFSAAAGLYYIQGNKITIGATGEKYYWHKWIVNTSYEDKYWIYNSSYVKDKYIPYMELAYGGRGILFEKKHSALNITTDLECRLTDNNNSNGFGARTLLDFNFTNDRFKMHRIDLEFEGYYFTNIVQYQTAYLQAGLQFNFKHFAVYTRINKPLQKNLNNPLIKYDDMELLFHYGLIFIF